MRNLFAKLWNDDAGVVTIEYLVLGTFLALALIAGVHLLATSINDELTELGNAIGAFSQAFSVGGFSGCNVSTDGSQAIDTPESFSLTNVPPSSPSNINQFCP
jgi:Flp pilus assembly pilin Flp